MQRIFGVANRNPYVKDSINDYIVHGRTEAVNAEQKGTKLAAHYRITVEPPVWVKPGEEATALAAMVATLERAIRAHPTQWFNFFDVWSPRVAA